MQILHSIIDYVAIHSESETIEAMTSSDLEAALADLINQNKILFVAYMENVLFLILFLKSFVLIHLNPKEAIRSFQRQNG